MSARCAIFCGREHSLRADCPPRWRPSCNAPELAASRAPAGTSTVRLELVGMAAVGELVQSTSGQWMIRAPQHCAEGHRLRPGHMVVVTIACSCGRHLTWRCEGGAVSYRP